MQLDFEHGFTLGFSPIDGLCTEAASSKRHLSNMKGMFASEEDYAKALRAGDPVVYEFYELDAPPQAGDLAFGTSIVYPGKIGDEYYMTKGHFHTILDTGEVYYGLSGHGLMLCENPEGDWHAFEITPGKAVYVPPRYAHRSINTGPAPLVTFFVFRADAGHDYGTIESLGMRHLAVEKQGKPTMIDNPQWK